MPAPTTLTDNFMRAEYQHLFDTCLIKESKYAAVTTIANKIIANKSRYKAVGDPLNIPWYFIGIVHNMESSLNFTRHLHNGDPLTARTRNVPAGRPATGNPPFTWEQSATDSLKLQKLDLWQDWSVPGLLNQFEVYNGMGYRRRGINSPYLWSFSNQYSKGKFTSDGVYDPNAISQQCGAAVLLRRLRELQAIDFDEFEKIKMVKALGEQVTYNPNKYNAKAEQLQIVLNGMGGVLRVDGKAGEKTSNEYHRLTNKYLNGDPRRR